MDNSNIIQQDMIVNNMLPSEPIHPGEVVKDELAYLGISQLQLAKETGIPASVISEIIHKKRQISVEYAMLFEAALNLDSDMLMGMQMDYNKEMALKDQKFMARLQSVKKIAASVAL